MNIKCLCLVNKYSYLSLKKLKNWETWNTELVYWKLQCFFVNAREADLEGRCQHVPKTDNSHL